jgi:Ca-activated chloride channel family protein
MCVLSKTAEKIIGKKVDTRECGMKLWVALVAIVTAGAAVPAAQQAPPQNEPRPVFKASVARVSLAATVRDRRGKPVTTLTVDDFHLFDNGQPATILEFSRAQAPVGIALLTDVSGSMDVAEKRAASKQIATQLLQWLTPGEDHIGLFAFDKTLEEVEPLRPAPGNVLKRMDGLEPYGKTSLFDAIADTGQRVAVTAGPRRAVVVLTDGYDNASRMSAEQVSELASGIDVPVYVIVVVSPFDKAGSKALIETDLQTLREGPLGHLARWTGGEIIMPVSADDLATATQQLVTELRHQYLMAFEPGGQPGWHPLEVRTRRTDLTVRARSGYVVPARTGVTMKVAGLFHQQ